MRIYTNQAGYLPGSPKRAILSVSHTQWKGNSFSPIELQVMEETCGCVLRCSATYQGLDPASMDHVWWADFSSVTIPGTYSIHGPQGVCSLPFSIDPNIYQHLTQTLCKALYFQRCGMALEPIHAGPFHRTPCHQKAAILLEDYLKGTPSPRSFDVQGGWHDAGDYGRYTTAAATALAHILYAYRWFPHSFSFSMNIPESHQPIDDILSECLYELKWLLKLQAEDGSVYHKLTSMRHANFVMPCDDHRQMLLFPPSTMSVGAFCAIMALASRTYAHQEPLFAQQALSASQRAYAWLEKHPDYIGFHNPVGCNTGEYEDSCDLDERLWAKVELYRTTGDETYLTAVPQLLERIQDHTALGWTDVAGFAGWALVEPYILHQKDQSILPLTQLYRDWIVQDANRWIAIEEKGYYGVAMDISDYGWGSNMVALNRGMLFATAYLLTGEPQYRNHAQHQMDYLLGVNGVGYSYVTGIGAHSFQNPHNRVTVADGISETIPGFVSGGPNHHPVDEKAEWLIIPDTPPMKCYLDVWECYSLNEITIYWNSPAIFLSAFLDDFSSEV